MHEMFVCESLIKSIEEQSDLQKFSKVKTVYLEIGVFAGIEINSLRFCFDVACRGTIADSAKLVISEKPVTVFCDSCQTESLIYDRLSPCPYCNSYALQYQGGDEMRITELEVY